MLLRVVALILLAPLMAPRPTVTIRGSADDQAAFEGYLEKCSGESAAFRELLETLQRSSRDLVVNAGRSQPGVIVDSFGSGAVDLDDLDAFPNPTFDPTTETWVFPAGVHRQTTTVCQVIAHFLWERYMSRFNGGRFRPGHTSGNDFEERIRRDYGQDGGTVDHTGQGPGARTVYRNDKFYVEDLPLDGDDVRPPAGVSEVNVFCLGRCVGDRSSAQFGANTCAACRQQAEAFCTARGTTLGPFICRSQ